jgi:hypothetical protein
VTQELDDLVAAQRAIRKVGRHTAGILSLRRTPHPLS